MELPRRNMGMVMAGIDPDPANNDTISKWGKDHRQELHPSSAGGAYVNFMMEEGDDRDKSNLWRQLRKAGCHQSKI
jgi:hypothetical protein